MSCLDGCAARLPEDRPTSTEQKITVQSVYLPYVPRLIQIELDEVHKANVPNGADALLTI